MSTESASPRGSTVALVGAACLFSALAVPLGPLTMVVGPAAAWLLHERRIDLAAVIGWLVGVAAGLLVVGAVLVAAPVVAGAIGPVGGSDLVVPITMLVVASIVFSAVVIGLGAEALRDLDHRRREHLRLDVIRLSAIVLLAVAAVAVTVVQTLYPNTEVGDAAVFALGAGAAGAIAVWVASLVCAAWEKHGGRAGTAAPA